MSFFQLKTLRHVCLSLLLCNIISKFNKLMGCILATFMFKAMYHYAVQLEKIALVKDDTWIWAYGHSKHLISYKIFKFGRSDHIFDKKKLTEETHFEHFTLFCQKNIQKISQIFFFKKSVKKIFQKSFKRSVESIFQKFCQKDCQKKFSQKSVQKSVKKSVQKSFLKNCQNFSKILTKISV